MIKTVSSGQGSMSASFTNHPNYASKIKDFSCQDLRDEPSFTGKANGLT